MTAKRIWGKFADFFALKPSIAGMLFMVVLVGMGERMAERFLPIYLLALGGGALSIGLLNGLDNLLSALYSFPGGYIADRFGTKKALMFFNMLAMAGFAVVVLVPRVEAVIGASFLFLSWTAISLPATMKLIAGVLPKNRRTMGVSVHSLVRRIPMALGPILGGTMIGFFGESAGVRMAFAVAFFLAMAALALQQKFLSEGDGELVEKAEGNPFRVFRAMSPELKNLLVSDILVRFCEQIPYPFAVVWAMKMIVEPVSAFRFGVLTAVEMIVALLIYIPVARLADRGRKKIFVVITFCFFTSFPIVLYFSRSFWPLVFAFTVRGLKEFGEPTRKSLILDLCPPGQSAAMFGLYYLLRDMLVSVAALGGAFLWMAGPAANFFTAAAFGAAGTAWFVLFGKDFPSTHAVEGGSR